MGSRLSAVLGRRCPENHRDPTRIRRFWPELPDSVRRFIGDYLQLIKAPNPAFPDIQSASGLLATNLLTELVPHHAVTPALLRRLRKLNGGLPRPSHAVVGQIISAVGWTSSL
ncbi:hypothetical protein [Methylomagnum sp.]